MFNYSILLTSKKM